LARRHGTWDVIETAGLKKAKAEITRLNEDLERRVLERTSQLTLASEALREAQTELAHVNRVTTMGELAASIAHETNQPITAAVTNAQAALRWLSTRPPDLEETRQALDQIVENGMRAGDVMERIRTLMKKVPPRKNGVELNQAILEVLALTRGEVVKNSVVVQTQLDGGLPLIQGDRVQLQQVTLNLIMDAVEAMKSVSDASTTGKHGSDETRRVLTACLTPFTQRSPAGWAWDYRFAAQSSKLTEGGCGPLAMRVRARPFSSLCR
jgi:C4-dicarboxylate-specific signal transduction histidine kinase